MRVCVCVCVQGRTQIFINTEVPNWILVGGFEGMLPRENYKNYILLYIYFYFNPSTQYMYGHMNFKNHILFCLLDKSLRGFDQTIRQTSFYFYF